MVWLYSNGLMSILDGVLGTRDDQVAQWRGRVWDDSLRVLARAGGRDEAIRSTLWGEYESLDDIDIDVSARIVGVLMKVRRLGDDDDDDQ